MRFKSKFFNILILIIFFNIICIANTTVSNQKFYNQDDIIEYVELVNSYNDGESNLDNIIKTSDITYIQFYIYSNIDIAELSIITKFSNCESFYLYSSGTTQNCAQLLPKINELKQLTKFQISYSSNSDCNEQLHKIEFNQLIDLKEISIYAKSQVNKPELLSMIQNSPNLQKLSLQFNDNQETLQQTYKDLNSLPKLEDLYIYEQNLNEIEELTNYISTITGLKKLRLSVQNTNLTNINSISTTFNNPSLIEELTLEFQNNKIQQIGNLGLQNLLELQKFTLRISQNSDQLTILEPQNFFSTQMDKLKYVYLEVGNNEIDGENLFKNLSQSVSTLYVYFYYVTNKSALQYFFHSLSFQTKLYIYFRYGSISSLGEEIKLFSDQNQLDYLFIQFYMSSISYIDTSNLEEILLPLKNLKELSITYYKLQIDMTLPQQINLPNLQEFTINFQQASQNFDQELLYKTRSLLHGCPNLNEATFEFQYIYEEEIQYLHLIPNNFIHLENLNQLNIRISNSYITHIANLETLQQFEKQFSNIRGIQFYLRNNKNLGNLNGLNQLIHKSLNETHLQIINFQIRQNDKLEDFSDLININQNFNNLQQIKLDFYKLNKLTKISQLQGILNNTNTNNLKNIKLMFQQNNLGSEINQLDNQFYLPLIYENKTDLTQFYMDFYPDLQSKSCQSKGCYFTINEQQICQSNYDMANYYDPQNEQCQTCENKNCHSCQNNKECEICRFSNIPRILPSCDCPPKHFTQTDSYQCIACQQNCLTCDSAQNCLQCEDGFYFDGQSLKCVECIYKCSTCLYDQTCSQCSDQSRDSNNNCNCIQGFYDEGEQICKPCMENCEICSSKDDCILCTENRHPLPNCQCTQNQYENDSKTCQQCHENCVAGCISELQCNKCDGENKDKYNKCECLNGFYLDQETKECLACNEKCVDGCKSATECVQCQYSQFPRVQKDTCSCPKGYFENLLNNQCEPCPPQCATCNSQTQCLTCQNPDYIVPNCQLKQTEYFVLNNLEDNVVPQVKKCHSKCKGCKETSTNCMSCQGENRKKLAENCDCLPGFHDNYGFQKNCQQCPKNCLFCKSGDYCTQCVNGFTLNSYNNKCEKCSFGEIWNPFKKECQKCNYYQRDCVLQCPNNSKPNQSNICILNSMQLKTNIQSYYTYGGILIVSIISAYYFLARVLSKILENYPEKYKKKLIKKYQKLESLENGLTYIQNMNQIIRKDLQEFQKQIIKLNECLQKKKSNKQVLKIQRQITYLRAQQKLLLQIREELNQDQQQIEIRTDNNINTQNQQNQKQNQSIIQNKVGFNKIKKRNQKSSHLNQKNNNNQKQYQNQDQNQNQHKTKNSLKINKNQIQPENRFEYLAQNFQ